MRGSRAPLVFDNCEQVAGDCAALIDGLLRFRVEGLRLPAEGTDVTDAEAVQLFIERMRAAAPGLQLSPADLTTVARLCRRLDGLPLAIELAAAGVAILGVAQIAERLDRDARVLRHPSKTAPARHRTLEATLDWSHRLLTGAEQILLRRLSAFRGSFSLQAAETVAAGAGIEPGDLVDLIAGLVDKSLLRVASRGAEYRYLMLETIREYGEAKQRDSGGDPFRRRRRLGLTRARGDQPGFVPGRRSDPDDRPLALQPAQERAGAQRRRVVILQGDQFLAGGQGAPLGK